MYDAKRMFGMKYSDPEIQENKKLWTFDITSDKYDNPLFKIKLQNKFKNIEPE